MSVTLSAHRNAGGVSERSEMQERRYREIVREVIQTADEEEFTCIGCSQYVYCDATGPLCDDSAEREDEDWEREYAR